MTAPWEWCSWSSYINQDTSKLHICGALSILKYSLKLLQSFLLHIFLLITYIVLFFFRAFLRGFLFNEKTTAKLIHIWLVTTILAAIETNIFQSEVAHVKRNWNQAHPASLGLRDHSSLWSVLSTRDCRWCWHSLEANKIWAIMYLMLEEKGTATTTTSRPLRKLILLDQGCQTHFRMWDTCSPI